MRREDNARSAMMAPQASFGAPMMERDASALDDDDDDDILEEPSEELEASADEMLAMPASAPMRSRASFAKAKKMSGGLGGGGGGGARGGPVAEPPPPRLRTTGLRLAFADEAGVRGTLLPMNLRERLAWLLEVAEVGWEGVDVDVHADANTAAATHGLEVDRAAALHQALFQLENAEARLTGRPAPAGVRPLTSSPARIFGGVTRTSIPDDGRDHRVEVHREAGDVDIIHLAVPRESFNVWRTCAFSPSGALPAGPVQVSEDGVFVVAGVADGTGGAAMHFNLGIDPQVKIESRTPTIRQSEKGLMGGQSVVEHSVVTEVRSTADHRVTLKVFDRFPVAGTNVKDVEVEVGECSPPVKRENRDHEGRTVHGAFRTDVVLMPRDVAVLRHAYTISLPAKLELSGGNRRE